MNEKPPVLNLIENDPVVSEIKHEKKCTEATCPKFFFRSFATDVNTFQITNVQARGKLLPAG
jgi:hypothetical protein